LMLVLAMQFSRGGHPGAERQDNDVAGIDP
jgi:hypothetical protein